MDDDVREEAGEVGEGTEGIWPGRSRYRELPPDIKRKLEEHRKWVESERKESNQADFRGADLRGLNFEGANLERANFSEANLQGAFLWKANLQNAYLQSANLQNANFFAPEEMFRAKGFHPRDHVGETNLKKARLWRADLRGADLYGADLEESEIFEAKLQRANLSLANLHKANLNQAELQDANLSEANLQKTNLHSAQLQKADLSDAILQGADLRETHLEEAVLPRADLQNAKLLGAKLRGANLQNADLTGAMGLLAEQFAQANVSGAKLPDEIKEFEGLKTVEETSNSARKIFLAMLAGCAYAALTIFSTADERLITNSASSPLPIIQTPIPIAGFYYVAPIILLAIYFYLHLYMQNLWHLLSKLPAVFPDGAPLDDKSHPWLLNKLVRSHFPLLRKERPPLSYFQAGISTLLAWWAVPFTVAIFWLWYVRVHDWIGTGMHIGFLGVGVISAIHFQQLAKATLRGREMGRIRLTHFIFIPAAFGAMVLILAGSISFGAVTGKRDDLIPKTLELVGSRAFVDLTNKDVSTKPPNWDRDRALAAIAAGASPNPQPDEGSKKQDSNSDTEGIGLIIGARLEGADLRHARAFRAFLVKANLVGAYLQGADLGIANLQGAVLLGAKLEGANLQGADLRFARFLTRDQIKSACVHETTKFPKKVKKPPLKDGWSSKGCKEKWEGK